MQEISLKRPEGDWATVVRRQGEGKDFKMQRTREMEAQGKDPVQEREGRPTGQGARGVGGNREVGLKEGWMSPLLRLDVSE